MNKLHSFKQDISAIKIPKEIAYPHNYDPHKIAKLASEELQDYLEHQIDFTHDFGFNSYDGLGKMFSVLVVKNKQGKISYTFSDVNLHMKIL